LTASLPAQAGLSSSAALELASAWALADVAGMDRLELARLCQRAENGYVGVNSGLMDQFAVSCGVAGHALLLDCRSLEYRQVALPDDLELVVVDTGAKRRLVASEYNERRAECERGVAILAGAGEPSGLCAMRTLPCSTSGRLAWANPPTAAAGTSSRRTFAPWPP
jgi:galactokinase